MKRRNWFVKVTAIAMIAAMLLAGCGNGTVDTNETNPANEGTNAANEATNGAESSSLYAISLADLETDLAPANYDYYSRDTLDITIMTFINSPYSEDATLIEEIEKATNTNITMNWVTSEGTQADQDRIAGVLSGGELPDIIGRVPDMNYIKNQEAAYPIQDLLKEYAPDYVNSLEANTLLESTDLETGEIFSMASLRQVADGYSFMIRTDWLENVGKEVPTTWDEFVDVLRAFKEQDANGDGDPNNEIPFTADITHLRYAFGINGRYNFCVEDGVYKPVAYHSNYKAFLSALHDLYEEGLLYQEYATCDVWSEQLTLMDSNVLGCTLHFAERAKLDTEALRSAGFEGQFEGIAPIVGPYGDSGIESQAGGIFNFVISPDVDEERAIELVRFLNFFYTEEGILLMNYGVEGVHYDMVDGAPVLKSEYADILTARQNGLIFQPLNFFWQTDSYMQMIMGGLSVDEMTETQKIFYDALNVNTGAHVEKVPGLATEAWNELQADLEPALKAFETNVICGNISMDDYDAELAKISAMGLDEVAEQVAAAYAEMNK